MPGSDKNKKKKRAQSSALAPDAAVRTRCNHCGGPLKHVDELISCMMCGRSMEHICELCAFAKPEPLAATPLKSAGKKTKPGKISKKQIKKPAPEKPSKKARKAERKVLKKAAKKAIKKTIKKTLKRIKKKSAGKKNKKNKKR